MHTHTYTKTHTHTQNKRNPRAVPRFRKSVELKWKITFIWKEENKSKKKKRRTFFELVQQFVIWKD